LAQAIPAQALQVWCVKGLPYIASGQLFICSMKPNASMKRLLHVVSCILLAAVQFVGSIQMNKAALESKTGGPLYIVNVNYNWEEHDHAKGVTVVFDEEAHSMRVDKGIDRKNGIAWATLNDELDTTGWMKLDVHTSDTLVHATMAPDDVKIYAAGFAEGIMTVARISQFYSNAYQLMIKDEANSHALMNIKKMFHDALGYVKQNTNMHSNVVSLAPPDPYWGHARYLLIQLWGIHDAYNFAAVAKNVHTIDLIDMLILNSHAEMPELMEAYTPAAVKHRRAFQSAIATIQEMSAHRHLRGPKPQSIAKQQPLTMKNEVVHEVSTSTLASQRKNATVKSFSKQLSQAELQKADREWETRVAHHGHCSALVRLGPENADVFVGHTTWDDYSKMTRIFKYYNFRLEGAWTQAKRIGMSSYPGCVSSTDNWYIMDSGLTVTDTSMEILNPTLYDRVLEFPSNSHLPDFMHVMIVNRMSKTGAMWVSLFSERNSGTGNAQWLIFDYNLFTPEEPIPDNSFWVVEQIPGIVATGDMSNALRSTGYWASFNRPYFKETRLRSGHDAAESKYGDLYSYDKSPRAKIFSWIGVSVENMFDMRNTMNRNNYPDEGVDPNEPGHAISARMDLDPISRLPNGGIDAKVVNYCLFKRMECQAISGPSHSKQKAFAWRDADGKELFGGWPHLGLPDKWDFDWVQMTQANITTLKDVLACPRIPPDNAGTVYDGNNTYAWNDDDVHGYEQNVDMTVTTSYAPGDDK
jgi:hypothetical protein